MSDRDLVRNAGDAEQVGRARNVERDRARKQLRDLREVLALPSGAGRRVLMRIMYEARTGLAHAVDPEPHLSASVWDPSSRIHYNAGRQDIGHLVQGWIRGADRRALVQMLEEAIAADDRASQENAAARTTPNGS